MRPTVARVPRRASLALLVGSSLLLLATPPAGAATAAATHTPASRPAADTTWEPALLGAFADSVLAQEMRRAGAPGAVLVIVRDGRVVLARGYGLADVDRRVAMDPERTVLRVGS